MRTFPDVRIRGLLNDVRSATEMISNDAHAEACELLEGVRARALEAGIDSPYVNCSLAVCFEKLDELEAAFEAICAAARHDPFAPPVQGVFNSVAWKLRFALAEPERALDDPSTPRIYEALMATGECDVQCHVAMARYLSAAGRHDEAMRLLDAVTLLANVSRDAWATKAAVARASGREELARSCETEAASIAPRHLPFGMADAGCAC